MRFRPQYHFTPESGWMNDPNGLVYSDGEYHLFYQYNPESNIWGPMHWGHAVSKDMVHWRHLPIALYPDSMGYIFSGCAVVDWKNSTGLGSDGKSPIIAIFTHDRMDGGKAGMNLAQYQSIAFSNDNGRTWSKYEGNPVLPNPGIRDFRDPKVIWHSKSEKWVMVLAACDRILIYNSLNLIDWTLTSEFGIEGDTRIWECPDLFPLEVENSVEIKWVLIVSIQEEGPNGGSATSYFVGDFDGKTFCADWQKQKWADYGRDNYAMVTWSDIPEPNGRRLALGWMTNWQYAEKVPTENWRGAMTLPRELTLHKERDNFHLRILPVRELAAIEDRSTCVDPKAVTFLNRIDIDAVKYPCKLELKFEDPKDDIVGVRISNGNGEYLDVYYHGKERMYYLDRTKAGESEFDKSFAGVHSGQANYNRVDVQMTIYLDTTSVELFADNGRCVMTDIFFASIPFNRIEILKNDCAVLLKEGVVTSLQNAC